MGVVFVDKVNVRVPYVVETDRLKEGAGYEGRFDADGVVSSESGREGNVYLRATETGTLLSGSVRNWADARGLIPFSEPFGPDEAGRALDALGDTCGLPDGALRAGRLTMVEGTVDLALPRPPADYVRAAEDVPRTTPIRSGDTTVVFKTARRQLKLYDRAAYLRSKGRPIPDPYADVEAAGAHVVRFEVTLRCGGVMRDLGGWADGEGRVRAGLLADAEFRGHLGELVLAQARRLQFGRVAVPDRPGMTLHQRTKWQAVRGIEATGGLDAALGAVRAEHAAGHLTDGQKRHRLQSLRTLYRDPTYTAVADLQGEFETALRAVEGR